jgi:cytochrome c2
MMFTAGAEEKNALTGKAAFVASKCSVCHKIEKVCGQVDEKNAAQWAVTVKRMASKGAGISEPDQKQIVDFLSSPAERTALCPD